MISAWIDTNITNCFEQSKHNVNKVLVIFDQIYSQCTEKCLNIQFYLWFLFTLLIIGLSNEPEIESNFRSIQICVLQSLLFIFSKNICFVITSVEDYKRDGIIQNNCMFSNWSVFLAKKAINSETKVFNRQTWLRSATCSVKLCSINISMKRLNQTDFVLFLSLQAIIIIEIISKPIKCGTNFV